MFYNSFIVLGRNLPGFTFKSKLSHFSPEHSECCQQEQRRGGGGEDGEKRNGKKGTLRILNHATRKDAFNAKFQMLRFDLVALK